jgi:hypothetical protein
MVCQGRRPEGAHLYTFAQQDPTTVVCLQMRTADSISSVASPSKRVAEAMCTAAQLQSSSWNADSATAAGKLMEMIHQTSALVGGDLCHGSTRLSSTLFLLYIHWPSAYIFPPNGLMESPRLQFSAGHVSSSVLSRNLLPVVFNAEWPWIRTPVFEKAFL